jgi:hypothetical protein
MMMFVMAEWLRFIFDSRFSFLHWPTLGFGRSFRNYDAEIVSVIYQIYAPADIFFFSFGFSLRASQPATGHFCQPPFSSAASCLHCFRQFFVFVSDRERFQH